MKLRRELWHGGRSKGVSCAAAEQHQGSPRRHFRADVHRCFASSPSFASGEEQRKPRNQEESDLTNNLQLGLQGSKHVQLRRLECPVHFSTHITKNRDLVAAIVHCLNK